MKNPKDQKSYVIVFKGKKFSPSVHPCPVSCDEEDDFLCGKVSASLPDFIDEEY